MSFILLGILNSQVTGAGGGAYELIESNILTSSASSVTFSSLDTIAADYKHLQLRVVARGDYSGPLVGNFLRLNGDSGSNYAIHKIEGNGTSIATTPALSQTEIPFAPWPAGTFTASAFKAMVIDILDFSSGSKNTTVRALSGAVGSNNDIELRSGLWNNTNAVTSISMFPSANNFVSGSRFSLYGLR